MLFSSRKFNLNYCRIVNFSPICEWDECCVSADVFKITAIPTGAPVLKATSRRPNDLLTLMRWVLSRYFLSETSIRLQPPPPVCLGWPWPFYLLGDQTRTGLGRVPTSAEEMCLGRSRARLGSPRFGSLCPHEMVELCCGERILDLTSWVPLWSRSW